jgi:hypothetical protein
MPAVLNRILIAIAVVLTIGVLGFIVYRQEQIIKQQTAIQSQIIEQKALVDGIVRSQNQYATKEDIATFAKNNDLNLKVVQDDLNSLKAKLIAVNVIHADSDGQNQTNVASTSVGKKNPNPKPSTACVNGVCPNQDPFGYQTTQQNLALNEDFGKLQVPIGNVGFSAWQQKPWNFHILPREYTVDTVIGKDVNERVYTYNKFNVKVDNKTYEIPIKTSTTKQEFPAATFSWWNPRLFLGASGQVNVSRINGDIMPSINVGIMSWGQFRTTPTLSVLEVGVGYQAVNRTASVVITPFTYNIGRKIFGSFMPNTYIGPDVSIATSGNISLGAGLRVGL